MTFAAKKRKGIDADTLRVLRLVAAKNPISVHCLFSNSMWIHAISD
jgi:hypothetical protein